MPWTAADTRKAVLYFQLTPAQGELLSSSGLKLPEESVVALRSLLVEAESVFRQMGESAASDGIKELVGDIVFADGGRSASLMRRFNQLRSIVLSQLGVYASTEPARTIGR